MIDVRGASEYKEGHISGAKNIFVGTIQDHIAEIDKEKQVVIHCQSGARAAIAESVLAKNGIQGVKVYAGGMEEWTAQENPVVSQ